MEGFLKVGSTLDWITPLIGFVQTLWNGRSVGFRIPENQGWSGASIKEILAHHGIKSWGYLWLSDALIFQVRLQQARFTEHLLAEAGVLYSCGNYTHPTTVSSDANIRKPSERKSDERKPRRLAREAEAIGQDVANEIRGLFG